MNVKPILFSGPMIRAILDGRKTMTRRVVKYIPALGQPDEWCERFQCGFDPMLGNIGDWSPYGTTTDRLWVREKWATTKGLDHVKPSRLTAGAAIEYAAGGTSLAGVDRLQTRGKWRPSIFMPRWASRITLEITSVKVERVRDISEEDAKAEGVWQTDSLVQRYYCMAEGIGGVYRSAIPAFHDLWDSINAKRGNGWDVNPWVWVVEFKRVNDSMKGNQ